MYLKPEKGTHFGLSFPFHIDPYRKCPPTGGGGVLEPAFSHEQSFRSWTTLTTSLGGIFFLSYTI